MLARHFLRVRGQSPPSRQYGLEHITVGSEGVIDFDRRHLATATPRRESNTLLAFSLRLHEGSEHFDVIPLPVFSPESGIWR
jgi:hypothetical protein